MGAPIPWETSVEARETVTERIDSVTIVGGGAAGWIMALFLTTMLNRAQRDRIRITLIESPRIPQIGVGEGTVTGFSRLLKQLDIPEKDFMLKSDASFKCAGRFIGWSLDAQGQPVTTLNPFSRSSRATRWTRRTATWAARSSGV